MRAHRGRCSFSVRSRYAQGVFISLHDSAPGLGALENGNAHLMCPHYLGIIVMGSGRAHHEVNVVCYIGCVMTYGYFYPLFTQVRGSLALRDIRAAYDKSRVRKHLGQRRHRNPAYADEVASFSAY